MTGKSTYLQTAEENWLKGTQMPTPPTALYVSLFSQDPTDAGVLTNEVTTQVRTAGRIPLTFGAITTANGTSTMTNSAAADFGNAANGGVTIQAFGVHDAPTGGNMLGSGLLTSSTTSAGGDVSFAAGQLTWADS